jgi:hypothetical protein
MTTQSRDLQMLALIAYEASSGSSIFATYLIHLSGCIFRTALEALSQEHIKYHFRFLLPFFPNEQFFFSPFYHLFT